MLIQPLLPSSENQDQLIFAQKEATGVKTEIRETEIRETEFRETEFRETEFRQTVFLAAKYSHFRRIRSDFNCSQ